MRLIDADKLIKPKVNEYGRWNTAEEIHCFEAGINAVWSRINSSPTVEVEPVRHGHWVEPIKEKYAYVLSGTCSVCGWESRLYENDVVGMNYCPNCGAKMDEKVEK